MQSRHQGKQTHKYSFQYSFIIIKYILLFSCYSFSFLRLIPSKPNWVCFDGLIYLKYMIFILMCQNGRVQDPHFWPQDPGTHFLDGYVKLVENQCMEKNIFNEFFITSITQFKFSGMRIRHFFPRNKIRISWKKFRIRLRLRIRPYIEMNKKNISIS